MPLFRCRKYDIQNELQQIIGVTDSKSKDNVLSCVHFSISSDSPDLRMSACSGNMMVTTAVKVDTGGGLMGTIAEVEKWSMAVDADKLLALCKKLPDKIIEINYEPKERKAVVRCDNSRYTLGCQEPTLFPAIPDTTEPKYQIPAKFFLSGIKYALGLLEDKEGPQVFMNGALVKLEDKVLEIVATDGVRMSQTFLTVENNDTFNVLLHKRLLREITIPLEKQQVSSIGFDIVGNRVQLSFGRFVYTSSTLVGNYPNYAVVAMNIQTSNDQQIRIPRAKLADAIDRCLLFSGKDQNSGINFTFSEKSCQLAAANAKGDSAHDVIDAESPVKFENRMNGEFVRRFCDTVPNDETLCMFVDTKKKISAVYFRGQSDRNYYFTLMPMNI